MDGLLKGKVAVVTGGGRGIGESIAHTFAGNGAVVVVADIKTAEAERVVHEIEREGAEGASVGLDVRRVSDIYAAVGSIIRDFGRIDIWVNNAGIAEDKEIDEISESDWDEMLEVDLKGVFFCSQAAFKEMKKRRSGRIINMASLAGVRGGRLAGAHYSAAKGGVIVITKCFALSGGPFNINVNAIAPGLIVTKMAEDLGWIRKEHKDIPLERLGTPDEVAETALYLASDMSSYITGQTINLNGGMHMN